MLITAGVSGIGRAMAEAFDATGAQITITDVDAEALGKCPAHWRCAQVDVTHEAAMAAVISELPSLDVLCANAGIAGPTAVIEDVALNDWRACMAVNVEGAFLATKYAAPKMKAAKRG